MLPVSWGQYVINGPHGERLFIALKEKLCFALQNDHPLGFFLIVPLALRRSVDCGDDPLDADIVDLGKNFDQFLRECGRMVSDEVVRESISHDLSRRPDG